MKRLIHITICFIIFSTSLYGQSIEIDTDLEYLQSTLSLSSNQLKQFTITSKLDDVHTSRIKIEVSSNDGLLVSLQSTNILIDPGVNYGGRLLGANGLSLVFAKDSYRGVLNNNFQFLPGNYTICYTLISTELVPESQKCFNIEVINPYELLLIYPFDEESIIEENPVFTWTPIILNGKRISYMMKLVESDKEEMDETSFRVSPAHFIIEDLRNNNYPYAVKSPKLNKTKNYFWKVYALVDDVKITESEIWRFDFETNENNDKESIWCLDSSRDYGKSPIPILTDKIGVKVANYSQKSIDNICVLDNKGNVVWKQKEQARGKLKHGSNHIELDLKGIIKSNKIYTIRVKDGSKTRDINIYRKVI